LVKKQPKTFYLMKFRHLLIRQQRVRFNLLFQENFSSRSMT
jgi:hypothetical protein